MKSAGAQHGLVMLRAALIALLLATFASAEEPPVKCDKERGGEFWPEVANHDPAARGRAMHCGTLYLCSQGRWRWKWRSVTVNYRQLAKNKTDAEPDKACRVEATTGEGQVLTSSADEP